MAARKHETIKILDCDVDARPQAAPGPDLLLPHVRTVTRSSDSLVIDFDARAARTLEAFVEAERLCCAGIGWEIERVPVLRLRISAAEAQLALIESLWNSKT